MDLPTPRGQTRWRPDRFDRRARRRGPAQSIGPGSDRRRFKASSRRTARAGRRPGADPARVEPFADGSPPPSRRRACYRRNIASRRRRTCPARRGHLRLTLTACRRSNGGLVRRALAPPVGGSLRVPVEGGSGAAERLGVRDRGGRSADRRGMRGRVDGLQARCDQRAVRRRISARLCRLESRARSSQANTQTVMIPSNRSVSSVPKKVSQSTSP